LQRRRLVIAIACALVLAPAAHASPTMFVGAAEDAGRGDPTWAKGKMDLAAAAGFDAIRLTSIWSPGRTKPSSLELYALQGATQAAAIDGIRILITVMPHGSSTVPLTAKRRAQFARYAAALVRDLPTVHDFIVGNEPNLNRYWLPQFTPTGGDAAATAYVRMLARAYDAMKAVDPKVDVIGGSVSPRGGDNPRSSRQTHSPTRFILDLGAAYRALHRTRPIMDGFAFHPYGETSHTPPTRTHPYSTTIGLADYPKLVSLLGSAFDGTAQRGSSLPIVYDEYGVQSEIPGAKRSAYTNLSVPAGRDAVSEALQATYYREAILMAACQPTVAGFMIFHVSDEPDLGRWQSGVYYADDTPKPARDVVRRTIAEARNATCPDDATSAAKAVWPVARAESVTLPRR
jgi:hypothetical protein